MRSIHHWTAGAILACMLPLAGFAAEDKDDDNLQDLKREMQQMRETHEKRLRALEERIERAEAEQAEDDAEKTAAKPAYETTKPGMGTGARQGFNPKIGAVLQGTAIGYSEDSEPEVPGFLLGPETEPRPEGLSLRESEVNIEANIDPYFRGWLTVAVENEEGEEDVIALEEAYLDTLALPHGLSIRAGRWFNEIGYQNRQHSHAWDFVDAPLVMRAFLARQLNDDGVQVRWLAPTPFFLELGAELLRGGEFPAGGEGRDGIDSVIGFAHLGGDIGASHSWRLGLSHLAADANGRETGEEDGSETFAFTGDSDLTVLDAVYKWAPRGNPRQQNFTAQFEYFHREEDGTLDFADDMGATAATAYDGTQRGFYVQGVYQFLPNWRVGARYDWLDADNDVASNAGGEFDILAMDDDNPERYSVMADWAGSEFSRVRLQYNRDESRPDGVSDNQVILQYIMSLGAHPAHQF